MADQIAVVMPAYQSEATIGAALASVASQTLAPAEVLIYDDCSTDGTVDVARAWEATLPIRVLRAETNAGQAAARHAAIVAAESDLIALLDSDDVWFPDHLESMTAAFATTNDGLASADMLRWIPGQAVSARPLSHGNPLPPPDSQLASLLTENFVFIATLFSRARYESVGGFRPQFRGPEDWDLWIRMVRAGAVVVRPTHPTVLYRLRENSTSSADAQILQRIAVLEATVDDAPLTNAADRRGHRTGMRRAKAQRSLYEAYEAAAAGHSLRARFAGIKAARGVRSVALRGIGMAVAPRAVARRRQEVRHDVDVWLKRFGSGGAN